MELKDTLHRLGEYTTKYPHLELFEDIQVVLAEIERLRVGADRFAYEYATAVVRGAFRSRTRVSDALEDYLKVGGIDGPATVPEWVEQYEAAEAKEDKS